STRTDVAYSRHVHILDRPEKPSPIAISRTSSPDGMGLKLRPLLCGATLINRYETADASASKSKNQHRGNANKPIRNRGCHRSKSKTKNQK
ncbi:hypothetical protein V4C53_15520, partial [Paraburkholderia azotifigens]|uniref:hypothetical protein n=1 Tax=Paraburkholderia azotifigens TaxID=2057004 RepID=UPI00316B2B1D